VLGRKGLEFGWSTFTADEEFRISMSNLGTSWAVTIYSMCLRLNLLTTPDLKL
jgi:hypothetical protein